MILGRLSALVSALVFDHIFGRLNGHPVKKNIYIYFFFNCLGYTRRSHRPFQLREVYLNHF